MRAAPDATRRERYAGGEIARKAAAAAERTQPNAGSYSTHTGGPFHTGGGGLPGERMRPGAPWPTPVRGSGEPFAPGTARGLRVSDSPASSRRAASITDSGAGGGGGGGDA